MRILPFPGILRRQKDLCSYQAHLNGETVSMLLRIQAGDAFWRRVLLYTLFIGIYLSISFVYPSALLADIGVKYNMRIEGVDDKKLHQTLETVSNTWDLREKIPQSLGLLRRRVNEDIPRFMKVLRSEGFYGAQIKTEIDDTDTPVRVVFRVDPGSPYVFKSLAIGIPEPMDASQITQLPEAGQLGLPIGKPAKSKTIVDAGEALIQWFKNRGFPFPLMKEQRAVVDHAAQAVSVIYQIVPGPRAGFGPTEIIGLESVDIEFIRDKIPWKEGERFNDGLLSQVQKRLIATGLFSTVQVASEKALAEDDRLPVVITVKERKHRTIKAGVSYRTDEGAGVKLSWEHRNLFGKGERVILAGTVSEIALTAEGAFRKPEFLHPDQSLLFSVKAAEDRPDAFTSRSITSSVQVERSLAKGMLLGAGIAFKASDVDQPDQDQQESFGLLSLPVRFSRDTSDNLLDPTRGGRLALNFAPFYDIFGSDVSFIKGYAGYKMYIPVWKKPSLVLAGRGALGFIAGADRDDIPADERFYAGGGDSIRGFPYQSVGPRSDDGPIGGRSLFEFSLELRVKVTEKIGFVPFIDGGSAFSSTFPDTSEQLGLGAGIGLRYFSPIGPLRLDIGVPLNRRDEIKDHFQIYFSIGQAF